MKITRPTIHILLSIAAVVVLALAFVSHPDYQNIEWLRWSKDAPTTGAENTNQADTAKTTANLSYTEAVKKYKNRFQFSNCSGKPGIMSVKRNTPVMLDNRDNKAHTIRANGQSFRIGAYGFAILYPQIVTKDNVDLSASNVTCDGGGAATLNVER